MVVSAINFLDEYTHRLKYADSYRLGISHQWQNYTAKLNAKAISERLRNQQNVKPSP
jgi:hypothetical protein